MSERRSTSSGHGSRRRESSTSGAGRPVRRFPRFDGPEVRRWCFALARAERSAAALRRYPQAKALRAKCCGCTEAFQASRAGSIPVARFVGPRGVAQSGSAPGWGPGGRRFKSCLPDQRKALLRRRVFFEFFRHRWARRSRRPRRRLATGEVVGVAASARMLRRRRLVRQVHIALVSSSNRTRTAYPSSGRTSVGSGVLRTAHSEASRAAAPNAAFSGGRRLIRASRPIAMQRRAAGLSRPGQVPDCSSAGRVVVAARRA
jgi:hypothetical protein